MPDTFLDWNPFDDAPWSQEQKAAITHFYTWDEALKSLSVKGKGHEEIKQLLKEEAGLILERVNGELLPKDLCKKTFSLSDSAGLPLAWFSSQVETAHHYYGELRFATAQELKQFLQKAIVPRGYLIAHLAGAAHRWQLPQVADLATAFFLVKKLVNLKDELSQGRLYIPLSDLDQAGVVEEDLENGVMNASMEKLMWKQIIRIRDAFAQGQSLVREVPRKFRRPFKKNWLTGLELVVEIERRKFDLWSTPVQLSGIQKFQINVLSIVGKGAGKARGR